MRSRVLDPHSDVLSDLSGPRGAAIAPHTGDNQVAVANPELRALLRADPPPLRKPESRGEQCDRLANIRITQDRDDRRRGDGPVGLHGSTVPGIAEGAGRVAAGSASASAERARCYRAEPADPPLERAAGQAHLKRELLVPLKLYPADRDPVDRHVDLAPRAVSEPLVAMLPDVAGAHRCQHLLVDCDGACRIRVGAPELAELLDVGGGGPALRGLERGRQPPPRPVGRAPPGYW